MNTNNLQNTMEYDWIGKEYPFVVHCCFVHIDLLSA